MEKPFVILPVLLLPVSAYSQGDLAFDNVFNAPNARVSINTPPGTFNPADGPPGAYIGSDYTASLFYLSGTISNQTIFDGSNPILFPSADTQFLGTTGTGPGSNGGFFDGGVVYLPTTGMVTIEVRAWYNSGGLYTSYDQALADGQNVGESNPVSLFLALDGLPPTALEGLLPFTVGVVPEPSVYGLLGLGGLLLFLRRKKA